MRISFSLLQSFFSAKLDVQRTADVLTHAGLEVDAIHEPKLFGDLVVVGEVKKVEPHPNADRLRVCHVDCGSHGVRVIVCGAPNVAPTQRVIVALPGAELPNGSTIEGVSIRGVASAGMICAADELGLGTDHTGIIELHAPSHIGQKVDEVKLQDTILEAEVTPNRPDWLSVMGIARELGACTGKKTLAHDLSLAESSPSISQFFSVKVNPKAASQYHLRLLSQLDDSTTPFWMQNQLATYGVASQHPAVDVTNFVLFEYGQPLHAFDADTVSGATITVRFAKKQERFVALDDETYTLSEDDIVICDSKKIIALAGIIGAKSSAVTRGTKRILLESAIFPPQYIRRTSKRLGIKTESAHRFERGIAPDLPKMASNRAAKLLSDMCHAKIHRGFVSAKMLAPKHAVVITSGQYINRLLGSSLSEPAMVRKLSLLGFNVARKKSNLIVSVPLWRQDVSIQADVAEEVARMHGYEKLGRRMPTVRQQVSHVDPTLQLLDDLRGELQQLGYSEIVLESWYGEGGISHATLPKEAHREITNPLQKNQQYLRTDLLPGLVAITQAHRQLLPNVRLFECGQIFWKRMKPPEKEWRVAFVASLAKQSSWIEAEQAVRHLLTHVLHCDERDIFLGAGTWARDIRISSTPIGHMVLKPLKKGSQVACVEFAVSDMLSIRKTLKVAPLPEYPSSHRDFAVYVPPSMDSFTIVRQLRRASPLILRCELFDVVSHADKVSYAFHLEFAAFDRTLTTAEIDVEMQAIRRACEEKGLTVRS